MDDPLELVCPQRFALPAAPSVAAAAEGRGVDLDAIRAAFAALARASRVPARRGRRRAARPDRAGDSHGRPRGASSALPLLVVARARLGTINHTLLTLEAIERRGLALAGVVISHGPRADLASDRGEPRGAARATRRPPRRRDRAASARGVGAGGRDRPRSRCCRLSAQRGFARKTSRPPTQVCDDLAGVEQRDEVRARAGAQRAALALDARAAAPAAACRRRLRHAKLMTRQRSALRIAQSSVEQAAGEAPVRAAASATPSLRSRSAPSHAGGADAASATSMRSLIRIERDRLGARRERGASRGCTCAPSRSGRSRAGLVQDEPGKAAGARGRRRARGGAATHRVEEMRHVAGAVRDATSRRSRPSRACGRARCATPRRARSASSRRAPGSSGASVTSRSAEPARSKISAPSRRVVGTDAVGRLRARGLGPDPGAFEVDADRHRARPVAVAPSAAAIRSMRVRSSEAGQATVVARNAVTP